jgi:hypothetical protein
VLDGVADGGHGGEVDDGFGLVLLEDSEEDVVVAEVGFEEGEVLMGKDVAEVAVFVGAVVVGVEVVEADDLVASAEQGFGESGTDETGGAGDENFHESLLRLFDCEHRPTAR